MMINSLYLHVIEPVLVILYTPFPVHTTALSESDLSESVLSEIVTWVIFISHPGFTNISSEK